MIGSEKGEGAALGSGAGIGGGGDEAEDSAGGVPCDGAGVVDRPDAGADVVAPPDAGAGAATGNEGGPIGMPGATPIAGVMP